MNLSSVGSKLLSGKRKQLAAAALFLCSASLRAGTVSFSTGDFATWIFVPGLSPLSATAVSAEAAGGNPGGYLRSQTTADDEQISFVYDTSGAFTYNPAAGRLRVLNSSIDLIGFNVPATDPAEFPVLALGAIQNGEIFYEVNSGTGMDSSVKSWLTAILTVPESVTVENSFLNVKALIDPGFSGMLQPDFSPGANSMTFGLILDESLLGTDVGYDNLRLNFTSAPDSGSTLALLSAAGLLFPAFRRLFQA